MGVKLCERTIESQQHSMQRSASSVECNEAMWEGPVMQKVKVHHQVCESPAGTLEHPMTNEILYDQESLVRITCKHIQLIVMCKYYRAFCIRSFNNMFMYVNSSVSALNSV